MSNSDIGEYFTDYREHQREKKSERYESTIEMLTKKGIGFQQGKSRNIIVAGRYELWPSTHAWFDRKSGKRGRGINGFLKVIGKEDNEL